MHYKLQRDNDQYIYELSGELTAFAHEDFRTLISEVAKTSDCRRCVLDMQELSFIDSGGLGMLLLAKDEFMKKQIELALQNPTGNVQKILKIARFDSMIPFLEPSK